MSQRGFKLGIVLLAHHRPQQLALLLATLRHPQVTTYLHIDSRSRLRPFQEAIAGARVGEIVWVRRHRSPWASVQLVDAELDGISRALADGCDYIILISGEDFPLRPIAEIVEFFEAERGRSFVEAIPLPNEGWEYGGRQRTEFYSYRLLGRMFTCIPRGEDTSKMDRKRQVFNATVRVRSILRPYRQFPSYLIAYGGQQWINLSPAAAAYVLAFMDGHPDYRRYHRHTACADEILIQSILLGSGFADTHEIVNDDLRFLIWDGGEHPKTLTIHDLPAMLAGSDLFARKLVAEQHPDLLAALQERTLVQLQG